MDFEIGHHAAVCRAPPTFAAVRPLASLEDWSGEDPDASALPVLFSQSPVISRHYIPYQAPPHVKAFVLDSNPFMAALHVPQHVRTAATFDWLLDVAMPEPASTVKACIHAADSYGGSVLVVPRLDDAVYVLLGEEHALIEHEQHRFVGASHWSVPENRTELVAYSAALGSVLGQLHFGLKIDGFGFSVVGGVRRGESRTRLFVQCDPRQSRRLSFEGEPESNADVVDRLAFILGRLAYVPSPMQHDLFTAFAKGYGGLRADYADAVLRRMNVYLE